MAARRSWLHTLQSICSLLPCRRLPDHIREELYRREMKMSEFSRSCWSPAGRPCLVYCGSGVGGFESLYVISHRFRDVSRWHSRDGILAVQMGIGYGSPVA